VVARLRRLRSVSAALGKFLVVLIAIVLAIAGVALAVVETGWAKHRIRDLIVRQANQYLTATLTIGDLEGSLLRGITLRDVAVSRDAHTLIHIDEITLNYSIRELVDQGVVVRRLRLVRPQVAGAKQPDGKWDLGALVRRESSEQGQSGPGRPIAVQSIEIVDGRISLADPLDFGAAHVPTDFEALNAAFSFAYVPVRWKLTFDRLSWIGHAPDLTVARIDGAFGRGPGGWFFDRFDVETPHSAFALDGTIRKDDDRPSVLDLRARASRFAFQEWSGVLRGLKNIAVDASFDTSLTGPVDKLDTTIRMTGSGGSVNGRLTLDTSVPGWRGAGAVDVGALNLARWLNRPDRPSDITGHVTFNLALQLGIHFPRGSYAFDGAHAMYMNYAADQVRAHGEITPTQVVIASADATAYGAHVTTGDAFIGIDDPFNFRFRGTTTGIDLRKVPSTVPVPRVESLLTFDYDVSGRFSDPFIAGHATFARSQFLGATVGAGTVGGIDTSQRPLAFSGEGDVIDMDLRRLGAGLEVAWLQDPRYRGRVSGHFKVEGAGTDRSSLTLRGGGRLARALLFDGALSDADVSIDIARGTLTATYAGQLRRIDPAIPFADPRFSASLNGAGRMTVTVRDLLTRSPTLADYDVAGTLDLRASTIHDVPVDSASVDATLRDSTLTLNRTQTAGTAIAGRADGRIVFGDTTTIDVQYDVSRLDLEKFRAVTGGEFSGSISTAGHATGPSSTVHLVGNAVANQVDAYGVNALALNGHYDVILAAAAEDTRVHVNGDGSFLTVFGQAVRQATGDITYDARRLTFDLGVTQQEGRNGRLAGSAVLRIDERRADLRGLTITLGTAPWRLADAQTAPVISWTDEGVAITPASFIGGNGDERIDLSGSWRSDGRGALQVKATHVFLDTLQSAFDRPTRYGGVVDAEATISGTRAQPRVAATFTVSNGRIERVSYQRLQGRVDLAAETLTIDARLDQSPGAWLTATGSLPLAVFDRERPEKPIDVAIKSSLINLGLIEGITDVVRNVAGQAQFDVHASGTSRDPQFDGTVTLANAGFLVTASGARYKNGRASLRLERSQITVDSLHVEDSSGKPLELKGGFATRDLRVGAIEASVSAQHFEVLRNELGRLEIDANLQLRGQFEAPRVAGDITLTGDLKVDEILQRTLFQPYSTQETPFEPIDAIAALNPWQRLGLDIAVHMPHTLRLVGQDVQVSSGTPIGLGDISLRVAGDLYLYKDPGSEYSLTGSFDSVSGTYRFQGRAFDVDEASSINFRGDLNPEIYVTVTRDISGVQTRVSIIGPLRQPELRLASTPPLDPSDILSLIVFNTSTNQLSAPQQQELLVRAGTIAAGFVATPVLSAIQSQIGLDVLEVEPSGSFGTGPKVTIGEEIAPGLVARFSRQFGSDPFDEASIEYYLTKILRLRATFSDAQQLTGLSQFRRIERAGIDLLFLFSF
jgi:autotransporter translocation and assembly factor TamB